MSNGDERNVILWTHSNVLLFVQIKVFTALILFRCCCSAPVSFLRSGCHSLLGSPPWGGVAQRLFLFLFLFFLPLYLSSNCSLDLGSMRCGKRATPNVFDVGKQRGRIRQLSPCWTARDNSVFPLISVLSMALILCQLHIFPEDLGTSAFLAWDFQHPDLGRCCLGVMKAPGFTLSQKRLGD